MREHVAFLLAGPADRRVRVTRMTLEANTEHPEREVVIAAGAENAHVPAMLGWERADNLTEAIAMARSYMGNSAQITMLHQPMIGVADME